MSKVWKSRMENKWWKINANKTWLMVPGNEAKDKPQSRKV